MTILTERLQDVIGPIFTQQKIVSKKEFFQNSVGFPEKYNISKKKKSSDNDICCVVFPILHQLCRGGNHMI